MKDEIFKLRTAERLLREAMTAQPMPAHAKSRMLEAQSIVINVRVALMKLVPTP